MGQKKTEKIRNCNHLEVLFISHGLYPCVTGGMEVFNYYLINELSRFFRISILTSCKSFNTENCIAIYENPRMLLLKRYGFRKFALALQDIFHLINNRGSKLIVLSYTSDSEYLGFYIPILSCILNFQYIIINHGGGIKPWKHRKTTKKLFTNAKFNISVSESIQIEYEKRTGKSVLLIPPLIPYAKANKHDVELLRNKLGLSDDHIVLFSVGSLKPIKNPIILLNAFISLGQEYIKKRKLILLFIGDGPLYFEMNRLIVKHSMEKYIYLLGLISNQYISAYYSLGNIYVMNSIHEGMPLSLLEAIYNRKIILASDSPGINSIISDNINGLLYEYNNVEELIDKLRFAISNLSTLSATITKHSKEADISYRYEAMLNQYISLINTIVS